MTRLPMSHRFTNSKGEPCVSTVGAAQLLRVSRQAVNQLIARGRLPAERIPMKWQRIIPVVAVQAWRRTRAKKVKASDHARCGAAARRRKESGDAPDASE